MSRRRSPDAVVVLGDTNTVPAYALAARRFGVPVVHLEAGLRSCNSRSLEEVNRRVAAATASLHLAPTELASRFLAEEGVPEERRPVVGNPITDVLLASRRPACRSTRVRCTRHRAPGHQRGRSRAARSPRTDRPGTGGHGGRGPLPGPSADRGPTGRVGRTRRPRRDAGRAARVTAPLPDDARRPGPRPGGRDGLGRAPGRGVVVRRPRRGPAHQHPPLGGCDRRHRPPGRTGRRGGARRGRSGSPARTRWRTRRRSPARTATGRSARGWSPPCTRPRPKACCASTSRSSESALPVDDLLDDLLTDERKATTW